jgi:hypothetical protein
MWSRLFNRTPVQTVMGHRLPEPRLTWQAGLWVLVYLGLPLVLLGTLIDLAIQLTTGICTGLWCFF